MVASLYTKLEGLLPGRLLKEHEKFLCTDKEMLLSTESLKIKLKLQPTAKQMIQ